LNVFAAIPTGYMKEYAVLYMLAALQNIDYPADKLSINIAVTDRGEPEDLEFTKRLRSLIDNCTIKFKVNITVVTPSIDEKERWGQYYAVICNLHELRKQFLDGNADYFWVLGGDNPPPRATLKELLKIDADIASAAVWQRPNRQHRFHEEGGITTVNDAEPIYFVQLWRMEDIHKRRDLDPRVKEALRSIYINLPMIHQIKTKQQLVAYNVSFGSGCSLSKKRVIEYAGYYLAEAGYCSEDLSFIQWTQTLGFNNGLNLGLHCGHFDPNGALY